MKFRFLFWVFIVAVALLQATFWSTNVILVLLTGWGLLRQTKQFLISSFAAGLILDTFTASSFGAWTLIFLFCAVLTLFWKGRFVPGSRQSGSATLLLFFLPIAIFNQLVAAVFYRLLTTGTLATGSDWTQVLVTAAFSLVLFPLLLVFSVKIGKDEVVQLSFKDGLR